MDIREKPYTAADPAERPRCLYEHRLDDGSVIGSFELLPCGSEYRTREFDIPLGHVFYCYQFGPGDTAKLVSLWEEKYGADAARTNLPALCRGLYDLLLEDFDKLKGTVSYTFGIE